MAENHYSVNKWNLLAMRPEYEWYPQWKQRGEEVLRWSSEV